MTPTASESDIVVGRGALEGLAAALRDRAPAPLYAVVSDANVAPIHGRRVTRDLEAAGLPVTLLTIPAGEAHKTAPTWADLLEGMGGAGLGRDGCVVAVGGGVTCDVAGFAAATYARGVLLVQVPTSLLAMVDAAIGGKTAIDLRAGKNLAGAFHPPRLVVVDPTVLDTLDDAELRNGLAEAVKHGAIADAAHLDWIAATASGLLGRDPAALDSLIDASVRIKSGIVRRDPREASERAVLNFGHTIAHALERASGYALAHGAAVAMGMVAEAAIGEAAGVTAPGTTDRVRAALAACSLPTDLPTAPGPAALLRAAASDKKARAASLRYVLLAEPGRVARTATGGWTHSVADPVVEGVLDALRSAAAGGSDV